MARPPSPAVPPPSPPLPPVSAVRPAPPPARAPIPPPSTLPARIEDPSPTLADGARVVPESRMLPPHQSKIERVTGHLAALSADLREWTELRIDLVKRQVEGLQGQIERVQHYLNSAPFFILALGFGLSGLTFLFVALAFGIGALVGSLGAGFLITAVLLLVAGGAFGWMGLRRVRQAQAEAAEARKRERDAQHRDRADIQKTELEAATNAAV